jgi:hypothetical protein
MIVITPLVLTAIVVAAPQLRRVRARRSWLLVFERGRLWVWEWRWWGLGRVREPVGELVGLVRVRLRIVRVGVRVVRRVGVIVLWVQRGVALVGACTVLWMLVSIVFVFMHATRV